MPKWFWIGLVALVLSLSAALLHFGLRPKPIVVIKPSNFASGDQIGSALYRQMREEWQRAEVLLIGLPETRSRDSMSFVGQALAGFFAEAERDHGGSGIWTGKSDVVGELQGQIPDVFNKLELIEPQKMDGFLESFNEQQLKLRRKVFVFLHAREALHRPGAYSTSFAAKLNLKAVPSIIFLPTKVRRPDEGDMDLTLEESCSENEETRQILSLNLGCYSKRQSITFGISRKTDRSRPMASVERPTSNDTVVYFSF